MANKKFVRRDGFRGEFSYFSHIPNTVRKTKKDALKRAVEKNERIQKRKNGKQG